MFKITGIFDIKFAYTGDVIRNRSAFTEYLKTEKGVKNFIDSMKPFSEIKIVDNETGEDLTNKFVKNER